MGLALRMQGTTRSPAAPDRRRVKNATLRLSLEALASKNLMHETARRKN